MNNDGPPGVPQAQDDLRKFLRAVEQSPAQVLITNADGEIEYVNPRFCQESGYSPEEVLGLNPRVLKSGETAPEVHRRMWDTITAGREWRGEFRNRRKNGESYTVSATVSPLRREDGTVTHYVGVCEDLTERRRVEREFQQVQERYRQSQKMDALGRLAGGVAHDFNNLLGVILGYLGFLEEKLSGDPEAVSDMAEIRAAAQSAAELTSRLLVFSRRGVGRPGPLDLNLVVGSVSKLLRRVIGEDIALQVQLSEEPWPVVADTSQLEQVLMNLAINAREAMPGGGSLVIATANRSYAAADQDIPQGLEPGDYVELTVTDTGCGMAPEVLEHAFEPFFTTKPKGTGTGLGLATAYGTVKQYGGAIQAESRGGTGATIRILLPRAGRVAEATLEPVAPRRKPGRGDGLTVLLVEDMDALRGYTRMVLVRSGYAVIEARTGAEALEVARGHRGPIDLLVSDLVLPGRSGSDLVAALREARPDLPAVVVTGYSDRPDDVERLAAMGIAVLLKPLAPGVLLSHLDDLACEARRVPRPPGGDMT